MKKSIGGKIFMMLGIMGIIFILAVVSNIAALGIIQDNNTLTNIYIELEEAEGEVESTFQRIQLYANLAYFRRDSGRVDELVKEFGDCLEQLDNSIATMEKLCKESGNKEVIDSFNNWKTALTEFSGYCSDIRDKARDGDFEEMSDMVNSLEERRVSSDKEGNEFRELISAAWSRLGGKSDLKISGTNIFDFLG